MEVDHINHNQLDNRKSNLRVCTHAQNEANKHYQSETGYKGVRPVKKGWMARIKVNKKTLYLGFFDSPEKAAHAYDEAAKKYFGEYAWLNF